MCEREGVTVERKKPASGTYRKISRPIKSEALTDSLLFGKTPLKATPAVPPPKRKKSRYKISEGGLLKG
jgi:hypothetical protein